MDYSRLVASRGSGRLLAAPGRRGKMETKIKAKYQTYIFLLRTKTDDHEPAAWHQIANQMATAYKIPNIEARRIVAKYRYGRHWSD